MKTEVKIVVPTNWSAVTLDKYLKLKRDMDAYKGEYEAVIACLFHHLCEFPVEYVQSLDIDTYNRIVNDLTSFISNVNLPLQRIIQIDGVEYGFEPNLSEISYGAYVDISKYGMLEINDKWAEIMSILYRPITKKVGVMYDIEPYAAKIDGEKFMSVPMDVHFGAIFFFKTLLNALLSSTLKSLTTMEIPQNIAKILAKNGEVIHHLSNSQTEIFSKLMK